MAQDNTPERFRVPRAAAAALVLPERWRIPIGFEGEKWRRWFRRNLAHEIEQRRAFPWIPVFFGLGIVLFFQAEGQPSLWAPVLSAALLSGIAIRVRSRPLSLAIMISLAALFAGFAVAAVRTRAVDAPVLSRIVIGPVTGFIEAVEDRTSGARLLLRVTSLTGLTVSQRPERVRVSVRDKGGLSPGQHIAAIARLLPPPQAAWPGGYDFARDAYFRRLGAVGSLVGPVRLVPSPEAPGWDLILAASVDEARNALTYRISQAVGGSAGGVAAALITGKRSLIEESTNDILRAAGIYHIVSISGLHMVLAAGSFFWLARALLSLVPAVALSWPVKKIAAVTAMTGAVGYCVFSGSEVATERSLIMTLVMFGAILVDRPALSIRNCAIAALIVLAREPESLLGPSFQMSFGAVIALIALAPHLSPRARDGPPGSWLNLGFDWALRHVLGLIAMTLVAALATAPFAAYHFQTLTPFGLIGNALALPLVSIVVMPAGLLGVMAYPFGLDRPVWQIMGAAVAKVLELSAWVSGFEGSTIVIAAFGPAALACFSLALLVGNLLVSSLRWLALIPAGAGLALAATPERWDVFVDREGDGAAIRGKAGRLVLVGRPSDFVVEQWLRADGDARHSSDETLREDARCDRAGCVVEMPDGTFVAFVQHISVFEEDCRRASIVLTRLTAPPTCRAALVLDRVGIRNHGATAARIQDGTIELRSTGREDEARPWAGRSRQATEAASAQPTRPRSTRPSRTGTESKGRVSSGEPD